MSRNIYWKKIEKVQPKLYEPIFYISKKEWDSIGDNQEYLGYVDHDMIDTGFYSGSNMAEYHPDAPPVEIMFWFPMFRIKK